MTTDIAFIHASPIAISPLMVYYVKEAPEFRITNLLDDGILRSFAANDTPRAEEQLKRMIVTARDEYAAKLAMVTCSAFPIANVRSLERDTGIPVVKIDEEMGRRATESSNRIGVAVTFEPTAKVTRQILLEAAGRDLDIQTGLWPEAHRAFFAGDVGEHDRILLAGVQELIDRNVDCIVLAQVSMTRILDQIRAISPVPVYTSLDTSLDAVRRALGEPA